MLPPSSGVCHWAGYAACGIRYCLLLVAFAAVGSTAHAQQVYPTPQAAAEALIAAVKSGERKDILSVVGRSAFDILSSGDDLSDAAARRRLVEDFTQQNRIVMQGDRGATLVTGKADTPFPIPLMRSPKGWLFDMAIGRLELLRARIARNETKAIEAVRAFVTAQNDYASIAADKEGKQRYAQRIISQPGLKNGLYWPSAGDEARSPMHDLVEQARAEGYRLGAARAPYHGYMFKVLFKQGPKAAGGSFDYNEQGKMVHGFALIAYPVQYGHSGVMTFMVNQSGTVYQKDLGAFTTRSADREVWFNPDQTWRKVTKSGTEK